MKAVVRMVNGNCYEIDDWPEADCLALGEKFKTQTGPIMTFTVDGSTVILARHHITAIVLTPKKVAT